MIERAQAVRARVSVASKAAASTFAAAAAAAAAAPAAAAVDLVSPKRLQEVKETASEWSPSKRHKANRRLACD
jgi:predicted transcriptional regulator